MTTIKDLICFNCKHKKFNDIGCAAFKEGIPDEILLSNNHSKPLPNKKNDIVFEEGDPDESFFRI